MEDSSDEEKDYERDGVFEEERSPEHSDECQQQVHQQYFHQQNQRSGSGGRERETTSRIPTPSTLTPTPVPTGNYLNSGGSSAPTSHNYWEHQNKENSPEVSFVRLLFRNLEKRIV